MIEVVITIIAIIVFGLIGSAIYDVGKGLLSGNKKSRNSYHYIMDGGGGDAGGGFGDSGGDGCGDGGGDGGGGE
jgi:hypothetical protein